MSSSTYYDGTSCYLSTASWTSDQGSTYTGSLAIEMDIDDDQYIVPSSVVVVNALTGAILSPSSYILEGSSITIASVSVAPGQVAGYDVYYQLSSSTLSVLGLDTVLIYIFNIPMTVLTISWIGIVVALIALVALRFFGDRRKWNPWLITIVACFVFLVCMGTELTMTGVFH